MSISRYIDSWFVESGSLPVAEVEPDHACQEFLPEDGVILIPAGPGGGVGHTSTTGAENLVRDLLG